jgi:hypothetical protein
MQKIPDTPYGSMPLASSRPGRISGQRYAVGGVNHPGGDMDVFTGR